MKRYLPVLLLLSACGAAPDQREPGAAVIPGLGADPVPCGADRLMALLGQPVTSLPGDEVPGPIRVIRPGDAVTEDFSATRLNVSLDGTDHIAALTCG